MRIIVFLLLTIYALLAYDAKQTITQADHWLQSKDTSKVLKAYHSYKNVRINAIMESDVDLHSRALMGVIKSGKLLHIDIERYQKELLSLGVKSSIVKTRPSEDKRVSLMTVSSEENKLLSMKWYLGEIVLTFERPVNEEELNYFALDKRFNNRYRYIFDIKAQAIKEFTLSKHTLFDVRLGTYDKSILRLVLENKHALALTYKISGRELMITPGKVANPKKVNMPELQETFYVTKKNDDNDKKVIVIDPGHGGKDSGAVGYKGYREKIIVYDIAYYLKNELDRLGYTTYISRKKGQFKELHSRTEYANKKNADLFISIHANAVERKGDYERHHGIETYFLSPAKNERSKRVAAQENVKDVKTMKHFAKENFLNILNRQKILASNKLAIDLQKGALSNLRKSYTKIRDGGVREGPFWVLVGAQMPAVLVEVGFITNPNEARLLVNKAYQQELAKGLALGVKHYFSMNP